MKNIFDKNITAEVIQRINKLTTASTALWGKMSVSQMLAHCNVAYEMMYEHMHPRPNFFMKFILTSFVKNKVVSETPYKHSERTAPVFLIKENKDFEAERNRLISYIDKTQQLGEDHFHNRESHSFGALSKTEWNNMLYKHLDHHLNQFGV